MRPTQGMLKTQPRLGSDGHGQLVERNRHTPIRRLLNGQLVVSAANVLDERMPGDDDAGATVLLFTQPRDPNPALAWSRRHRMNG